MSNRNINGGNGVKNGDANDLLVPEPNATLSINDVEVSALKGSLEFLKEEVKALKSSLSTKDAEITALKVENENLKKTASCVPQDDSNENIRRMRAENLAMELELTKRGIRKPVVEILPASAFMEIVYAPSNGASRFHGDLVFDKEVYSPFDKEGFLHFNVPKKYAHFLLGTEANRPYKYVGPDDTLSFVRTVGRCVETVTVLRHALDTTENGEAGWVPLEVVESKDMVE